MMFHFKIFLFSFIYCLTPIRQVLADDIPVILWNIQGETLHTKPVSALGNNDNIFTENLDDILKGSSLLVFTFDELSLEDFFEDGKHAINHTLQKLGKFLDSHPHMLLPSVKDPLSHIHKTHCGVQEIVVDQTIDEKVVKLVSTALEQSCAVILHLSDGGITSKEQVKEAFLPSFQHANKNIVGAFTAAKSSWQTPGNEHYLFRNLLESEEAKTGNFINITDCLIMYAENASIVFGKNNSVALPFPATTEGSKCENSSVLVLDFTTTGEMTGVKLTLNFPTKGGSWSTTGSMSITGGQYAGEYDVKAESLSAPNTFSYSCGDLELKVNVTKTAYISLKRFQVQPYNVKPGGFSESFDCVPFFTIPIWMGVFVSLLFIVIINVGVYALFSVHTMDQFDDPKGKTISVAVAD